MTLLESSISSLRARVTYLVDDFNSWQERTSAQGQLKQHNSQVIRITNTLSGTLSATLGETAVDPAAPTSTTATLSDLPDFRRSIGTVHLLWEYFRDKFAQRDVDAFELHLGVADDLAWACYEPCLKAAVDSGALSGQSVKEPPLVFYSPDRTPFARARTKTFNPQGLDSKDVDQFIEVLQHLPVPVIGIPWAIANRLPDLVVVGHEVGHVVAEDLHLTAEAKKLLADLDYPQDDNRRRNACWKSWSDEVFGDVFGVFATGSAFTNGLAAELAADVDDVRKASVNFQRPGSYPTPTLRMAICESVLEELGISPSPFWSDAYDRELIGNSRDFRNDVQLVSSSLVERRWEGLGGMRLADVLPWREEHEENAQNVANSAFAQTSPLVPFSVRTWVAASVVASQMDAQRYAELDLDREFARSIVSRRTDGLRSARSRALRASGLRGAMTENAERLRESDETTGKGIARMLKLI